MSQDDRGAVWFVIGVGGAGALGGALTPLRTLTHRQRLQEVWGPGQVEQTHYLRVYMANLRRKLEADPARPRLLRTEPGVGYRLLAE